MAESAISYRTEKNTIRPKARWICLLRLVEKCFILHLGFDNMIYWLVFSDNVFSTFATHSHTQIFIRYRRSSTKSICFIFTRQPFFRLHFDYKSIRIYDCLGTEWKCGFDWLWRSICWLPSNTWLLSMNKLSIGIYLFPLLSRSLSLSIFSGLFLENSSEYLDFYHE